MAAADWAEASIGKEFSPKRCPNESMSMEAVTGEEERLLRLCPTKRKVPTAGHLLEGGATKNKEADEEGHQEGKAISDHEVDGSDDDDDKSITENEFDAFCEEERADYEKFWQEEMLPRNPHWEFKDYSLATKEGDACNGNAKAEAAPESK